MRTLHSVHKLDLDAFCWCLRRKRRTQAIILSRFFSYTANGPFYVLAGVCFAYLEMTTLVKLLVVAFAIERCVYFVCKSVFKRNRPQQAIPGFNSVIEPSDKFSFPSGHTSAAFLVACAISSAFPVLSIALYTWAVCVGIARVMLGVHFPTDVLAGAIMGHTICLVLVTVMT